MPVKSNRNGRKNTIYQQTNNVSYDGQPQLDADDGHDGDERPGHTRSPVFAREPTMLESFSRTVRNYVPSSIPIPAAAPSPPTVSRPFITSTSLSSPGLFDDAPPSGLAQAMHRSTTGADSILWARWDALQARRLLILGYSSGLQVWDCTNLGSVVEVLNLNEFPDVATFAAVLPGHNALGILTSEFNFLVYSLASHDIIKRIPLSTPVYTFTANHEFIVISTTNPPTLQVLASPTFSIIHTVVSASLVPFTEGTIPPHSIFTLSRRLLAYASVPPPQISSLANPVASPAKPITSTAKSMISGMRTLGGLALSAAVSSLGGDATTPVTAGRFFSRSAPAAASSSDNLYTPTEEQQTISETGYYVTVIDLRSKATVASFMASKYSPLSTLTFSPDGCSVLSIAREGQMARVHQLQPVPGGPPSEDLHVYDLHRGRTSAVIESVEWSNDGRWIAICTRKKTIHVFAVNPYGGPPDLDSHLSGRVINSQELQSTSVDVTPIIRLRPTSHHSHSNGHGLSTPPPSLPPTFRFLDSQALPPALLPVGSPAPALIPIPSSSPSSPGSPRHSQAHTQIQQPLTNFQDMVVFDPVDGLLQLRRWILSAGPTRNDYRDHLSAPSGMTSVSLPLGLGLGRSGSSPHDRTRRMSGSGMSPDLAAGGGEGKTEGQLVAVKDTVVATWDLKRRRDWVDVKKGIRPEDTRTSDASKTTFLSEAELETSSTSHKILPRSVYLSHQFSFHTLGEDYHALIRRYQFDVVGTKIEVRRQVQVSAYTASHGGSESFVEGSPVSRRDLSFDEPLASALLQSEGFADRSKVGTVLPMLPNGHGHARMASIPIRGVSESFGRLRREMMVPRRKGRRTSSSGWDSGMSMSVPLEFDEDDEDFAPGPQAAASDDGIVLSGSRSDEDVSTPATSMDMDPEEDRGGMPVNDEVWNDGWGVEDKRAIEEVEMYDHISAVGLLDEEQEEMDRKMKEERERGAGVGVPAMTKTKSGKSSKRNKRK